MRPTADVGVFGGSGFYRFLDQADDVALDTPFGAPSDPVTIGVVGDKRVAFIARHGKDHRHMPSAVPARANLWALRALGVRTVIGPCAAGSLTSTVHPGDFVVLDQLVDRTWGRPDTFYDAGLRHHVSFADPYCPVVARAAVDAGRRVGVTVHERGTVVVVQGPRFSTRAESAWYRAQGWEVVNMTQYPEAYLARELGMHYAGIALITDYDTGVEHDPEVAAVTQDHVFTFFEENLHRMRALLLELIPRLAFEPAGCDCNTAIGPLSPYETF
ncbi:MAG: S-methyl-5'-thioadenosine phosphorylase [Acidimicrobiia bacterium]